MRGITITYDYSGDETDWRSAIIAFIDALDNDPKAENFSYQVSVADNGISRIHWGRWDSQDTLTHVQSQEYFKVFAARVSEFSNGTHHPVPANVIVKTSSW